MCPSVTQVLLAEDQADISVGKSNEEHILNGCILIENL